MLNWVQSLFILERFSSTQRLTVFSMFWTIRTYQLPANSSLTPTICLASVKPCARWSPTLLKESLLGLALNAVVTTMSAFSALCVTTRFYTWTWWDLLLTFWLNLCPWCRGILMFTATKLLWAPIPGCQRPWKWLLLMLRTAWTIQWTTPPILDRTSKFQLMIPLKLFFTKKCCSRLHLKNANFSFPQRALTLVLLTPVVRVRIST